MLELKHVAVECIYPRFLGGYDYLDEHNIYTVQDFIDNYDKLPEKIRNFIDEDKSLEKIERRLNFLNREERELDIRTLQQYSKAELNEVDKYNLGKVLIIFHPLTGFYRSTRFAKYNNIERIKRCLGLIGTTGKNFFVEHFDGVGYASLDSIIKALDMYTQQVERQAKLMGYDLKECPNAFVYQEAEKKELIKQYYSDIIEYLISLETDLWYGQLSPTHIKNLVNSINGTCKFDKENRENFIQYISNYTTLPELEDVAGGTYRSLNRFIKPGTMN